MFAFVQFLLRKKFIDENLVDEKDNILEFFQVSAMKQTAYDAQCFAYIIL